VRGVEAGVELVWGAYLEVLEALGGGEAAAGRPDAPAPLRTPGPADGAALGRQDTLLAQLLEDARSGVGPPPRAVALVAVGAAVGVAAAEARPRRFRGLPRQRAVTLVRGDARAGLRVVAALAAAHVAAAAPVGRRRRRAAHPPT
jgi:hypothetical protein